MKPQVGGSGKGLKSEGEKVLCVSDGWHREVLQAGPGLWVYFVWLMQ